MSDGGTASTGGAAQVAGDVDLPALWQAVRRRWLLILIAPVLGAAILIGGSFVMTPSYRATALVAYTEPAWQTHWEESFVSRPHVVEPAVAAKMAMRDDIIQPLVDEAAGLNERAFAVSPTARHTLLLSVTANSGDVAAAMANRWAARVVAALNQLAQPVEGYRDSIRQLYEAAEQAVQRSQAKLLERLKVADVSTLESRKRELEQRLDRWTDQAAQDLADRIAVEGLRTRLQRRSGQALTASDRLLVAQLLSRGAADGRGVVAAPAAGEAPASREEALETLQSLQEMLDERASLLDEQSQQARQQLGELAVQIMQGEFSLKRLVDERDRAAERHAFLERELDHLELATAKGREVARIAAAATPPVKPFRPQVVINGLIGGLMGLSVALLMAVWGPLSSGKSRPGAADAEAAIRPGYSTEG